MPTIRISTRATRRIHAADTGDVSAVTVELDDALRPAAGEDIPSSIAASA